MSKLIMFQPPWMFLLLECFLFISNVFLTALLSGDTDLYGAVDSRQGKRHGVV